MNQLARIEAKLDALLAKAKIEVEDVIKEPPPVKPRELTPAEKQAIANAPKPTPAVGPTSR